MFVINSGVYFFLAELSPSSGGGGLLGMWWNAGLVPL
jgi:hypothetical protein